MPAAPAPGLRPETTSIKVFEFDMGKPIEPGKNPLQIATGTIPFDHRLPRRARAALAEVTRLVPNRGPFEISHATDGSVIATVTVHPRPSR